MQRTTANHMSDMLLNTSITRKTASPCDMYGGPQVQYSSYIHISALPSCFFLCIGLGLVECYMCLQILPVQPLIKLNAMFGSKTKGSAAFTFFYNPHLTTLHKQARLVFTVKHKNMCIHTCIHACMYMYSDVRLPVCISVNKKSRMLFIARRLHY